MPDIELSSIVPELRVPLSDQGKNHPTVEKLNFNPILNFPNQSAPSIYWPYFFDLNVEGKNKIGMVWSTDHASHNASGIWFATADDISGPWTQHGRIFRDDVGGVQCETPSVIWDAEKSRWLMYYQLATVPGAQGSQVTLVASAPSFFNAGGGLNAWTRLGIACDVYGAALAGDGHTGYFKPFRYGGGYYGHSLCGGTDYARLAFWASADGVSYVRDPRIIGRSQPLIRHLVGYDSTWVLELHKGQVINRAGRLWMICTACPKNSGGVTVAKRVVAVPMSSDGFRFGRAVDITPPAQAWETSGYNVEEVGGAVIWRNKVYVPYRSNGATGGFGVMEIK